MFFFDILGEKFCVFLFVLYNLGVGVFFLIILEIVVGLVVVIDRVVNYWLERRYFKFQEEFQYFDLLYVIIFIFGKGKGVIVIRKISWFEIIMCVFFVVIVDNVFFFWEEEDEVGVKFKVIEGGMCKVILVGEFVGVRGFVKGRKYYQ